MALFVIKNSEGLYWSKENTYTPHVNFAKTYVYEDAVKAANRRNCTVHEVVAKYIFSNYSFFLEER